MKAGAGGKEVVKFNMLLGTGTRKGEQDQEGSKRQDRARTRQEQDKNKTRQDKNKSEL